MKNENLFKHFKQHHEKIFDIVHGDEPLPDNMFIGKDCKNGHGADGETVRYLKNRRCIKCASLISKARNVKKYCKYNKDHEKAIDISNKKKDDLVDLLW